MLYLFFQTFFWILAAFILGLLIGWWFCGRCRCNKSTNTSNVNTSANLRNASVDTSSKTGTARAAAAATATAATVSATATKPSSSVVDADVSLSGDADAGIEVSNDWKPKGFSSRPSDADQLKRIKGIGPVIEKTLNGLGVYQFKQIAEFSQDNISWVENHLSFPGRIEREGWVPQAKDLASGRETEFSKRVDKGDLDY